MAIAGRVAIVPKGDWSADATYKRLDAVTHNNTLYFAKKDVPAGTATSNTEYWSKSVVGGEATVDDTISSESTNPVQNKVVKAYVDKKASENIDFSTSTSKLLNDTVEAPLVLSNATRNLLNPKLATTTINGITCTNNGDGTYTFNGTATDNVFFDINRNIPINKGTKYKVVCFKDEDYVPHKIMSCVRRVDTSAEYIFGNGSFVSETENCWLWVQIAKDVTVSNLVAKPMITTDLNATYDNFVPYSGYDIKTCGKNLFNLKKVTSSPEGVTGSVSNGIITLNGTVDTSSSWQDLEFNTYEQRVSLKRGVKYTISTKDKVQKVFIFLRESNKWAVICSHDCSTSGTTFVASKDVVCRVTVTFKESSTFNNTKIAPQLEVGEKGTEYEHYQDGGTVHIDSTTEFPLLGLKSFDGETNIISPGNVEVTYAKSDSGKAILDMSKNKLDKDNVVNNQTTTVEGFALDARQANPNIDGSLAKQISDLNGSLNKSHMDCLWTGKASNMERVDFSNPISNYPSARMLIFVFHYDVLNYECMFDFPIFNLKTRTNFLANNTEIALSIIPPDQIFDTFCYLTWTSTKDYYLKSVYIEY